MVVPVSQYLTSRAGAGRPFSRIACWRRIGRKKNQGSKIARIIDPETTKAVVQKSDPEPHSSLVKTKTDTKTIASMTRRMRKIAFTFNLVDIMILRCLFPFIRS
jgi:hypothetical protein